MIDIVNSEQFLETSRMLLEPLLPSHAKLLYSSLQNVKLYDFIPIDPPKSLTSLEERYTKLVTRKSPDGSELWFNWAMCTKNESQYVGILEATIFSNAIAKVAYIVFNEYWHQGYGREGCKRILEYLTTSYSLKKIVAEIDTRNFNSLKLIEALGFNKVQCVKDADFFKGASSDEYHYELIL